MTNPQSFPIVLLVTCFIVVVGAIVLAIRLESAGFRRRYRMRRGSRVPDRLLPAGTAAWIGQRELHTHVSPVVRNS